MDFQPLKEATAHVAMNALPSDLPQHVADQFNFFEKAVVNYFYFLESDYGYVHTSTEVKLDWERQAQFVITYRSAKVEIQLLHSLNGKFVSCSLSRLVRNLSGMAQYAETCDISFLIEMKCPQKEIRQHYDKNTNDDIARILHHYALILKEYGQDVLTGTPEVFLELQDIVNKHLDETYASGKLIMTADESGEVHVSRKEGNIERGT